MLFKVGDTLEFEINDTKQRGNVLGFEGDCAIMNLFAVQAPTGQWFYMGVHNELPIQILNMIDITVIES